MKLRLSHQNCTTKKWAASCSLHFLFFLLSNLFSKQAFDCGVKVSMKKVKKAMGKPTGSQLVF